MIEFADFKVQDYGHENMLTLALGSYWWQSDDCFDKLGHHDNGWCWHHSGWHHSAGFLDECVIWRTALKQARGWGNTDSRNSKGVIMTMDDVDTTKADINQCNQAGFSSINVWFEELHSNKQPRSNYCATIKFLIVQGWMRLIASMVVRFVNCANNGKSIFHFGL